MKKNRATQTYIRCEEVQFVGDGARGWLFYFPGVDWLAAPVAFTGIHTCASSPRAANDKET
jgi:hypothetical protein